MAVVIFNCIVENLTVYPCLGELVLGFEMVYIPLEFLWNDRHVANLIHSAERKLPKKSMQVLYWMSKTRNGCNQSEFCIQISMQNYDLCILYILYKFKNN